jgi:peptidoglycan/xylan/chitin deacetylase (PgdA/CDA1 family)
MTQGFRHALDLARDQGRTLRFWLRDDDATRPGPALTRLMALCADYGVPPTLAVIPAHASANLAAALSHSTRVALHGWAHENHAGPAEKKQELGAHRPRELVLAELARGLERLRALFPDHLINLLVPPWNRIAPEVIAGLPGIGIRALSAYGKVSATELPLLNPEIDPIDWHGTRSLHDPDRLWHDLTQAALSATGDGHPIGILTHHLDHDAAIWDFLARLMALTDHPACRWVAPDEILPELRRGA